MGRWSGALAVEGRPTADGRLIAPDATRWADLGERPIPLMRSLAGGGEGDWSMPLVGYVDRIERREAPDGAVLIWGEGPLMDGVELPDRRDLSATYTAVENDYTAESPLTLSRGDLRQVVVGSERVWDECVLTVADEVTA